MVRYYVVENRIVYQNKDDNGNVIGQTTKEPLFMKKYPYFKIAFDEWANHTLLQTYEPVEEATELTLEEAQAWVDANSKDGADVSKLDTLEIYCDSLKLHELYGVA